MSFLTFIRFNDRKFALNMDSVRTIHVIELNVECVLFCWLRGSMLASGFTDKALKKTELYHGLVLLHTCI